MENLKTKALLEELQKRSEEAASIGDVREIIKGIGRVAGALSYSPYLPERNQGRLDAAEDVLYSAAQIPVDPEAGPFTPAWRNQIAEITVRSGSEP